MTVGLVTHLWQTTLFAGVAGLFVLALRRNQARLRHLIWFAASAKFLIPFSLLVGIGALAPHRAAAPPHRPGWVRAAEEIAVPLTTISSVAAGVDTTAGGPDWNYVEAATAALWACGFAVISICWLVRWRRIHDLRRSAIPVSFQTKLRFAVPVMSAPGLAEPGIFGVLRPVLLLPEGIEGQLDCTQMDAIIAHELCHVRSGDNLTATIQMLVQAIFWFHPLVWWLGARQLDERERACDEEVLSLGFVSKTYAEAILNVCRLYVGSPLACMPGVTGSNLKRRIEAIMCKQPVLKLSFVKKAALTAAGITALLAPVIFGVVNAPAMWAQAPQPAQSATEAPKFEVAAIKLCDPNSIPGTRGGGPPTVTPRSLIINCQPLIGIIQIAYLDYADGHHKITPPAPIEGAPGWLQSDRYLIEAKSAVDVSSGMIQGPMVQALLEDRFKLNVHRQTRQVPVYELAVAKGGPKLKAFAGGCKAVDSDAAALTPKRLREGGYCLSIPSTRVSGATYIVDAQNYSLEDFVNMLYVGHLSDRPIFNKTGISGLFDFHLEFTVDPDQPRSPSALQEQLGDVLEKQLGVKLQSTKGPSSEFLVLDHIERHPSEN